jgi:hypothetical protein
MHGLDRCYGYFNVGPDRLCAEIAHRHGARKCIYESC